MTLSDCVQEGSMVNWWAMLLGSPAEGRCSPFRGGCLSNSSLQSLLVTVCQDGEAGRRTQMICLLSLPDTFMIPLLYSKSFRLLSDYWIKGKVWHEKPATIWCPNQPFTLYLQPLTSKNPPLSLAYLVLCASQRLLWPCLLLDDLETILRIQGRESLHCRRAEQELRAA